MAPLQSAASELHTVSAEFQTIHRDYQGLAHFFKDIFWELLSVGLALTACEQQGPDSTLAPDSLGRVGEWCASKTQRSFHRAGGAESKQVRLAELAARFTHFLMGFGPIYWPGLYPELSSLTTRLLESAAVLQRLPQSCQQKS